MAKKVFKNRQGILIKLQKNDITALGEATPLPGFSSETSKDVVDQIKTLKKPITNLFSSSFSMDDIEKIGIENRLSPSLHFALFTAGASLLAQQNRQSLHHFLYNENTNSIPLNAVADLNTVDIVRAVSQHIDEGFQTLKIKAGNDAHKLLSQLQKIRKRHPHIKIRIDANQSWSLSKALSTFDKLESLNIEYCEEPLAKPTFQSLNKLKGYSSVPIALDESLVNTFVPDKAFEIADVLIIKPMTLGPITVDTFNEILSKKKTSEMVFTSSLEGSVGRLMTATIAAGLGSKNKAHGIATGGLFETDFWNDDSLINNGNFNLPNAQELKALMNIDIESLPLKKVES